MGKRSEFKRKPRDFYPTPEAAVLPLIPHLAFNDTFSEPCAGNNQLVEILEKHGMSCVWTSDIEPQSEDVMKFDAFDYMAIEKPDYIITNSAWDRKILHPLIDHFRRMAPTWLLIDADWMHTKQSAPFMKYCHKVVSVGRVKWIPDSKMTGKDNCAWYLFDKRQADTLFFGQVEKIKNRLDL